MSLSAFTGLWAIRAWAHFLDAQGLLLAAISLASGVSAARLHEPRPGEEL